MRGHSVTTQDSLFNQEHTMKCGHFLLCCLFLHPGFHKHHNLEAWPVICVTDSVGDIRHDPPAVIITNALPSSNQTGGELSSQDVPDFWSAVPAGHGSLQTGRVRLPVIAAGEGFSSRDCRTSLQMVVDLSVV